MIFREGDKVVVVGSQWGKEYLGKITVITHVLAESNLVYKTTGYRYKIYMPGTYREIHVMPKEIVHLKPYVAKMFL